MGQTKFFLLWFQAPLQSWGFDSRFGRRETWNYPTRSGVLGLLLCAMGAGGPQRELLARFGSLDLTGYSLAPVKVAPFAQPAGKVLTDFHMVGSNFDESDLWQNLLIPKKTDGKAPNGSGSKMTYRRYLQDSVLAAVLEVPSDLAEQAAQALTHPYWDMYLGRKCCVPTAPIYRGTFETAQQAEQALASLADENGLRIDSKALTGSFPDEGETMTIEGDPVAFGLRKVYKPRTVTMVKLFQEQ